MEDQFHSVVLESQTIVITSHISPDADAVSSSLLLSETLRLNYPNKRVVLVLEEKPNQDLSFLQNYQNIRFGPVMTELKTVMPELFIIVDANKLERVSRNDVDAIRTFITENRVQMVLIDHHEPQDKDESDIFINNMAPAAAQEVYELCFEKLKLQKPQGFAETAMLGVISDTARFKYHNPGHRETFRIVSDLIDAGANIEELENRLSRYSVIQLEVVSHLSANAVSTDAGYNYSFVDDEFAEKWISEDRNLHDYKTGCEIFINQYIRNLGDNTWGFVVYPDIAAGKGNYSVSFRALWGQDVSAIASRLGGGGHKSAAAAKLQLDDIPGALEKINVAIKDSNA